MTDPAQAMGDAQRKRFKLSFWALAVYGLALGTLIWLGVWLEIDDTLRLRRMVIRMLIWFPVLYGVGWLAYRLGRRSSMAGSIAFGCAAAAVGGLNAALLVGLHHGAKREADIASMDRLGAELRAEETAAASKGLGLDMDSPKRLEARKMMERLSRTPGEEGAGHRANAAALQEAERLTRTFNDLLAAMEPNGAIDDAVFLDADARKRRMAHVDKTVVACDELERFFGAYPELVHTRARQEGAGEKLAAELRDSLKSHPRFPIQREFYGSARETYKTIARMLAMLDDPARRWQFEPEAGIRFEEAADGSAWNAAVEKLESLGAEQVRLRERLAKV